MFNKIRKLVSLIRSHFTLIIAHTTYTIPTLTTRSLTSTKYPSALILEQTTMKEGNVLFNDTLNTFYLRLYSMRHMVKDHSDKGNLQPPHGLLSDSQQGSFICTIPQTG